MFKNRTVTIKVDRQNKENTVNEAPKDDRPIEVKAKAILHIFEKVAVKAFAGVCIYVVLDTHRQVAVARASNPI